MSPSKMTELYKMVKHVKHLMPCEAAMNRFHLEDADAENTFSNSIRKLIKFC